MNEKDRQTLKDNLYRMSENCNFDNILEYLKLHNVFTRRQLQEYESENFKMKTEELKCQQLFTDIQTRGPEAFSILSKCLIVTGHSVQYHLMKGRSSGRVIDPKEVDLKVKKSTSFPSGQDVYKMTSRPRGFYIFINNITFLRARTREGAEADESFKEILEDMGYVGEYYKNKSKQEMRQLLKDFSTKEDLAHVDSLIVAISSHGNLTSSKKWMIDGTDDKDDINPLLVDDIMSLFNSNECKLPKGQPRIFFINACRGEGEVDGGRLLMLSPTMQTQNSWEDTFLIAPCFEGLKANRNIKYGSWLFLALVEVFKEHAHNKHLEYMDNLITDRFDKYFETSQREQTASLYTYGVDKKLFFNPGLFDQRE